MMVMNLGIGNITPPVGSALFSGCSVADMDMEDMIKPILPFYAAIFVALMLVFIFFRTFATSENKRKSIT